MKRTNYVRGDGDLEARSARVAVGGSGDQARDEEYGAHGKNGWTKSENEGKPS